MYSAFCVSLLLIPGAFGYLKATPVRHSPVSSQIRQSISPVGKRILRISPVLGSIRNQVPSSPSTDFQYLKKLDARVKRLGDGESDYLLSFWSDSLKCFQIYPNMSTTRVSITTTCMAIGAILANPAHWERSCRWDAIIGSSGPDGLGGRNQISLKEIVESLTNAPWSGDPFQTPMVINALCSLKAIDCDNAKFAKATEELLSQRARLSLHRQQNHSTYLLYQNIKALLAIVENNLVPEAIKGTNRIGYALERSNMVSFDELCRQLAFYNSGDSANFDVIILTFSLLSYWETSQSRWLSSFARGVVSSTNMKLVESALEVIFASQAEDGTWVKGEPIFSSGDSPGGSRDIGNSYVFFFDIVSCLLTSMADSNPELLAPYLTNFEKCLTWAEGNIVEEMLADVCDPNTGRCYGNVVKGWRSNHLGNGGAVAWCTAQVFTALSGMRRLTRNLITSSILAEFGGKRGLDSPNPREWAQLMDADLELAGDITTLKKELLPRLLEPQSAKQEASRAFLYPTNPDSGSNIARTPPLYSAILFGPPGTAKTTICTSIASYLGWNFLTIDTASFLADGLQNVASRMTYIFDRLKTLERTIILFDEIEEFCLDRENPSLGMESRMLTTAMLTQLNDLRRQQSVIFIVATNRLRSFDAAVTRPGRFDFLLFVGTPNLMSREKRLVSRLEGTRLSHEKREEVRALCMTYMTNRWSNVRFQTFAENEALLNFIIDTVSRGELTSEALSQKVGAIAKTATIQGSVRDDYVASEALSRV